MEEDYSLDGLSDGEVASFIPTSTKEFTNDAGFGEVQFLRKKVEALEYEKYSIALTASNKIESLVNGMNVEIHQLKEKIKSLEFELQIAVQSFVLIIEFAFKSCQHACKWKCRIQKLCRAVMLQ
jgi:hypothetical protein